MKDYRIRKEVTRSGQEYYWVECFHGVDEHDGGINEIWRLVFNDSVFLKINDAKLKIDRLRRAKRDSEIISTEVIEYPPSEKTTVNSKDKGLSS